MCDCLENFCISRLSLSCSFKSLRLSWMCNVRRCAACGAGRMGPGLCSRRQWSSRSGPKRSTSHPLSACLRARDHVPIPLLPENSCVCYASGWASDPSRLQYKKGSQATDRIVCQLHHTTRRLGDELSHPHLRDEKNLTSVASNSSVPRTGHSKSTAVINETFWHVRCRVKRRPRPVVASCEVLSSQHYRTYHDC